MSSVVSSKDDLDSYLRDKVETILVSGRRNTSITLHLRSHRNQMVPLCGAQTIRDDGWLDKSVAVYPPGFAPFCSQCAKKRFDVEVASNE